MYEILVQACGVYETNCYIVKGKNADVVIDPGVGAIDFVRKNCKKIYAVLNTHAHHDHVWDNCAVIEEFLCQHFVPKDDIFMLENKEFRSSKKYATAVSDGEKIVFDELEFRFLHFPGHTPGCSMIEFKNYYFSGDFLFERSIGRWDFEHSSAEQMIKSLQKAKSLNDDFYLLPGHGNATSVRAEKPHFDAWIRYIK